jgi:hypothetical protein
LSPEVVKLDSDAYRDPLSKTSKLALPVTIVRLDPLHQLIKLAHRGISVFLVQVLKLLALKVCRYLKYTNY